MASTSRKCLKYLGVILPLPSNLSPADYEWTYLEPWLVERGVSDVRLVFEYSYSDGLHTEESLRETGSFETLLPHAQRLAEAGCDAIVWACTSGSFIGGLAWARAQADALASASGLPATSTSLALIAAIDHVRAHTVDLLSPYPKPVTASLEALLREAGLRVDRVESLDFYDGASSNQLDLQLEVLRFAGQSPESSSPLLIACTSVNGIDLIQSLESQVSRPVITANQASVWHGLALVDSHRTIKGAGTLFRSETEFAEQAQTA